MTAGAVADVYVDASEPSTVWAVVQALDARRIRAVAPFAEPHARASSPALSLHGYSGVVCGSLTDDVAIAAERLGMPRLVRARSSAAEMNGFCQAVLALSLRRAPLRILHRGPSGTRFRTWARGDSRRGRERSRPRFPLDRRRPLYDERPGDSRPHASADSACGVHRRRPHVGGGRSGAREPEPRARDRDGDRLRAADLPLQPGAAPLSVFLDRGHADDVLDRRGRAGTISAGVDCAFIDGWSRGAC